MFSVHSSKNLLVTILLVTTAVIIYLVVSGLVKPKIAFVNSKDVFENFIMTKEIKILGDREVDYRKHVIDSLYGELNSSDITDKEAIMNLILQEKESFNNFSQSFTSVESEKVWLRIKDYSKEFSSKYGYDLILGSQPDANIIYGDTELNKTEDFIKFINDKYEGNK